MANDVTVRIPKTTYAYLEKLLNQETTYDEDGNAIKVESSMGTEIMSNNQVVNLALLGYLSNNLDPTHLNLLIQNTPKISPNIVTIAGQRLNPKQSVIVPADVVAQLLENQTANHKQTMRSLKNLKTHEDRRFMVLIRYIASIFRGVGALVSFLYNRPVDDRKSFDDKVTKDALTTLTSFGADEVNNQKEMEARLKKDMVSKRKKLAPSTKKETKKVEKTSIPKKIEKSAALNQVDVDDMEDLF